MSLLLKVVPAVEQSPVWGWVRVRALVVDSVSSRHSRRVYTRALDDFRAWSHDSGPGGFTRETVQQYRAHLESRAMAPATVNLHLTVLRKLAREAVANGVLAPDIAAAWSRAKRPAKGRNGWAPQPSWREKSRRWAARVPWK